jgi:hypothetical protein
MTGLDDDFARGTLDESESRFLRAFRRNDVDDLDRLTNMICCRSRLLAQVDHPVRYGSLTAMRFIWDRVVMSR